MEFGIREGVQFLTLVASLAGAFAVVKSQLSRAMNDLELIYKKLNKIDSRVDAVESTEAVINNQMTTFKQILSPANLANHNREVAGIKESIKHLKIQIDRQYKMHNGSHPWQKLFFWYFFGILMIVLLITLLW